jgi:outer membrane protein TolC
MKITNIFFSLFFMTSLALSAQEEMNLPKAISIGLENNYGIKINEGFIQIAENNNTWARAGKLPTVDLSANYSSTITQDNNPASFLRGEYFNGSLNASASLQWVVYSGGRVRISKDQLTMAIGQQKLIKDTDIHSLIRTIHQQYYNVLFQQERLLVLQSSLDLSKERLAYEETRRSFGVSNSFNLIQFENAVLTDSTNVVNQSQQVEISKRNFYNSMQIIGFPNYNYSERLSINLEDIDIEKLKILLSEDNYTLKSLSMIADLNKLNSKLQQTNLLPTVRLNSSVSFAENGFQIFAENPQTGDPYGFIFSNRITGNIGASASWNLYDGGVRKTDVQNAIIQEDIDQLSMLEAKATLTNQLEILGDNYNNQRELLDLSNDQIQLAQKNLEITEQRFKGGLLSSIDFRNVQNQYLNAAFGKVNAIYNLIITKSEIDFLVGSFSN